MVDDTRHSQLSARQLKERLLEMAGECEEVAASNDEQARLYEEAGITGIHPSSSSLRASARAKRVEAEKHRELAARLS